VINVELDNGTRRSFTQGSNPPFSEGDRIKVVDGRLALLAKKRTALASPARAL
jgi:hypothetical protein